VKTKTNKFDLLAAFIERVAEAEGHYLRAKQKFLEDAVSDPSTAVAIGGRVVQWQSHFESLKNAEGYVTGGDYPSNLAAVEAAIDYFTQVLIRGVEFSRSTCDIYNGVESARLKGVRDTVNALGYFKGMASAVS
jgi:hypothetical protein